MVLKLRVHMVLKFYLSSALKILSLPPNFHPIPKLTIKARTSCLMKDKLDGYKCCLGFASRSYENAFKRSAENR